MIIYTGVKGAIIQRQAGKFNFRYVESAEAAIGLNILNEADVFIIGPEVTKPTREIQKIYAADKHLSIILFAQPSTVKQIKQAVQFTPFIGNNTLVITLHPEINLQAVCESAANRTRQKRSFFKINLSQESRTPPAERIKIGQMGTFLEYAPIAAMILSETDRIVNYNRQAQLFFPALQFIDVDLTQLFPNEEAEQISRFVHSDHLPDARAEIALANKIMELTSTRISTEEGQQHFLLLFSDITYRHLETQRIHLILEALPQMAWTTDPQGKVTYLTEGWFFYTGQVKEEALGDGWASAVFPEDRERLIEQWSEAVKAVTQFQHAARYKNTKGEYRWHLVRSTPVKDSRNEVIMWVGTCTDIHDQILLTEELERKVKERTHSLEAINNELEQFAHVSSHDLQEPLRKIRTFAELIKDNSYENLDEPSKRYIDKISTTAERMSDSLKALLNYTRLNREEKSTPVDLNHVVSQVLVDLELLINQKNAVIHTGHLPTVKSIPIQMQQLFYNLINNALKFAKTDIPPKIEIASRPLMEEELSLYPGLRRFKQYHEITVKDNGIGFDQKHEEKIFAIFQRLHPKSQYEGSGIGLSLVKKVVSNHGGEIFARSSPGNGATFHVILPAY
ncbi:MAG TPA: ATP-binding protein [Chitinophagaceae bacterium]|nr:ATP-binding protein [Chitinophagaceae bacterium]